MHRDLHKILLGIVLVWASAGCNYPAPNGDPGDLPPFTLEAGGATAQPEGSLEPTAAEGGAGEPTPVPDTGENAAASALTTRTNPGATFERYNLPGWELQVLEVLRGAEAWAVIQADNSEHPAPPAGYENLLVRVELKCLHLEGRCPSIGLGELYVTGASRMAYTDYIQDAPAHEIYFIDFFPAELMEGLCDFFVPVGESNLELVFSMPAEGEFPAFSHHIALEDGAGIPPYAPAGRTPNQAGLSLEAPAPFGELVQTADWDITLLESLQGAAVEAYYTANQVSYRPAPEGYEYVLLKARVGYYGAGPGEIPQKLDIEQTVGVDSQGGSYPERVINFYPPPSNYAFFYPGGLQEGWLLIVAPVGETNPVLRFEADSEPRYLRAVP